VFFLLLAAIAAASMWFYVIGIQRTHQIDEARTKEIPRGNLSDLYPRWLGTRELLLHHRNPYSREVALEIQEGYYGRRLDPARPNDPKDQQGFAYPVYVVFLLAPLVGAPFPALVVAFYWFLVLLTAESVCWWTRVLRWQLPGIGLATCIILTLGSFPAVQGIRLQQLSLLVAALLAGSAACASGGFLFCGGALLALATIKPQLASPLVAWLLVWVVGDWRKRRRLAFGFGMMMVLLLTCAEIILPGWWRMFAVAIRQYQQYTQSQSVLEDMLRLVLGSAASGSVGRMGGYALAMMAGLACSPVLWELRKAPEKSMEFGGAVALVLAWTVMVIRDSPYNQMLLLPAILLLMRERAGFLTKSRAGRLAYVAGCLVAGWQWAASLSLSLIYLLGSRAWTLQRWTWPLFATFVLPMWVFALILFRLKEEPYLAGDHA
jgi:hypothetical protein